MDRRIFAIAFCTLISNTVAIADPLQLVSAREMQDSLRAGGLLIPRSRPDAGAPRIEFDSPELNRAVVVPASIRIRFIAEPPARPDPSSFRVYYGAFRIDITERLTGVAKVTPEGINLSEATLPSGRHQLLMSLTDSLGREGQRMVSFTVK